jgi:hypothetical protein
VPILNGSLDAIYEVAQKANCKNCHQMRDGNETYQTHVRLGRFTREVVPPERVGHSNQVCQGCHTAANGFVDNWRAPEDTSSLDLPISDAFCGVMQSAPFGGDAQGHLLHDPFILWAVARVPGVGTQGWQQKVSAWLNSWRTPYGSLRTPCLCQGKWDCGGRAHGQFTP